MQNDQQREGEMRQQMHDTGMALLRRIEEHADDGAPIRLLELAETYAWVVAPGQPHGSNVTQTNR